MDVWGTVVQAKTNQQWIKLQLNKSQQCTPNNIKENRLETKRKKKKKSLNKNRKNTIKM